MNIGIISTIGDAYSWAGSEEMWRGVALAALAAGEKVAVSAAVPIVNSLQADELRSHGVGFYPRARLNSFTRRLATRSIYSRYKNFLGVNHDVLCVSMGGIIDFVWMPDLVAALEGEEVPYVVLVQANAEGMVDSEVSREDVRRFYNQAKAVVFVSAHNLELAERQLGLHLNHAVIIPNPLRKEVAEPVPWPSEEPCFRIAEVARLELADKQQDHLLKALSGAAWRDRNWKLTLYGSGPDEEHIRHLIDFYGLSEKVEIGGFVSDFRDIWRDNHLHVLPSRREGMPLSLIESMASGRPAVVTRAGGSAELVEHGVSGWVCPGMHPEVLGESLELAWDNRQDWQKMGLEARERILQVQEPDWAGKVLSILQEAATRNPR